MDVPGPPLTELLVDGAASTADALDAIAATYRAALAEDDPTGDPVECTVIVGAARMLRRVTALLAQALDELGQAAADRDALIDEIGRLRADAARIERTEAPLR